MKNNLLSHLLVICFAFSTLALPVYGQAARPIASSGVAGTLDPKTGIFTAFLPSVAQDPQDTSFTATTYNGKLVFNFTITVASSLPSTAMISCDASARVLDNPSGGGNFLSESGAVPATRNGSTASCAITIPYSWPLVTGSTDTMTLSYFISAFGGTFGSSTSRGSSQGIGTFKIPSPGVTSTFAVKSTI